MTTGKMRNDTRTILRVGTGIFIAGVIFAILVKIGGGIGQHGPPTNLGWFGLIFALGCLPASGFLLLLGFAKWFEDRRR